MILRTGWATRHGDSERSPAWAVLDDQGHSVDLGGWIVRAQMRATRDSPQVDFAFIAGDGIAVGSATLAVDGRVVNTSTVQLYLDPADWTNIPNPYAGVLDVEVASDSSSTPAAVHTLLELAFTAEEDVTRG
jgi:hypothetical protein